MPKQALKEVLDLFLTNSDEDKRKQMSVYMLGSLIILGSHSQFEEP
jgi:hypothetical protein